MISGLVCQGLPGNRGIRQQFRNVWNIFIGVSTIPLRNHIRPSSIDTADSHGCNRNNRFPGANVGSFLNLGQHVAKPNALQILIQLLPYRRHW